jgi:hypothetical protein
MFLVCPVLKKAKVSQELFQRDQEHHLKHPGLVDLISTNQNKQTTFLHR